MGLLRYFNQLIQLGIKSPGRLTKMERCSDALRYMRFGMRAAKKGEELRDKLVEIDGMEERAGILEDDASASEEKA